MTRLNYSPKKLGKTFKLQKDLSEIEMNHEEVSSDTWMDKKSEWLVYVKNDVSCTVFSYARYCKAMEDITGLSVKHFLSLPGLGWKYFNSLRTEEDEPIYTYNETYMSSFVRQSIKGGRVCAFNPYYKSKICDDVLKIITKQLCVRRKIYDIIEEFLKYKTKQFKVFEKEYESKFDEHRNEDVDEKEKYINEKISNFRLHKLIQQIKLIELLWDFDAVSLYPSAMWDKNSVYPKIQTGYAFTTDMNEEFVEKFNTRNFY